MPYDQPLDDTWNSRDLPVLRAVVAACDAVGSFDARHPPDDLDFSPEDLNAALRALTDGGLVDRGPRLSTGVILRVVRPTAEARRYAGSWPGDADQGLERMIAALDAIAENTDDADTRTRAQKIRAELAAGTKSIGLAVVTSVLTGQLPT